MQIECSNHRPLASTAPQTKDAARRVAYPTHSMVRLTPCVRAGSHCRRHMITRANSNVATHLRDPHALREPTSRGRPPDHRKRARGPSVPSHAEHPPTRPLARAKKPLLEDARQRQ